MNERERRKAKRSFEEQIERIKPQDVEEVLRKKGEIEEKLRGPLGKFIEDVELFFNLLKDFVSGRYREVPWFTVAAVAAALLYILNPFDVIPDYIPVIGLIDDASVVALCLKLVEEDLVKYRAWREKSGRPN